MARPNEAQQRASILQQEVSTFIAENLTQEMVEGPTGFGIAGSWAHAGIRPCISRLDSADWPVEYGGTGWGIRKSRCTPMPWLLGHP